MLHIEKIEGNHDLPWVIVLKGVSENYVFYEGLWFHRTYMRAKTFLKPGLKSSLKLTGLNRINPVKGGVYW